MYGNKIDNLIKMREAGIRVPDFQIIRFEDVIDLNRYEHIWESQPDGRPTECGKLRKRFKTCVRDDYREKVEDLTGRKTGTFAVRSSCNLEDGEDSSFAGQFDTFLNVGHEEIAEKVLLCMESMFQENVLCYMEHHHIPFHSLRMCVLVQDMVDADRAGVLFTANPQGILNESVIVVGRGLGEGVVSGTADTTTYYYHRTDKLYYYEGTDNLLSNQEVEEMIALAGRLEEVFGGYLDIEFAYNDGELFVLQARPITTLKGTDPLILDNSNIVESYPGLSLPLTISFVDIVYSGVFKGVSRRVLKNERELAKLEDVFKNMVGHANGRVYYKISNWYTILKFLPFHKRIIPVWQEMLGVKNKGYDEENVKISPVLRIMTYVNSFYELFSVPRHMKMLEREFERINRQFYESYRTDLSPKELIALYLEIKEKLLDIWDVTLLNDMYTFIYTGLVKSRLRRRHPDEEAYVNQYISGISNIESMKPIRALIDLAYHRDEFTAEEYEEQKQAYIREYGDRNLEELKLESKTFRSNPELLDERIEGYREDMERLQGIWDDMYKTQNETEKEDLLTRFLGRRCAAGIAGREKSRLNRSRIYGMVRLIFMTMGESYAKDNILQEAGDIFYLTVDEVFVLADEEKDMTGVVKERKEIYELYGMLPSYSRLIFEDKEFDKRHSSVNAYKRRRQESTLQGVPCSGGEITAEALVIQNVQEAQDVTDKILVTKMTDPGWVFLLATAKGVISEKGSLLSHTAIISREMKIPSIVGVENLLDTVKTGDLLRMDGNTGKIEIIRRK